MSDCDQELHFRLHVAGSTGRYVVSFTVAALLSLDRNCDSLYPQ